METSLPKVAIRNVTACSLESSPYRGDKTTPSSNENSSMKANLPPNSLGFKSPLGSSRRKSMLPEWKPSRRHAVQGQRGEVYRNQSTDKQPEHVAIFGRAPRCPVGPNQRPSAWLVALAEAASSSSLPPAQSSAQIAHRSGLRALLPGVSCAGSPSSVRDRRGGEPFALP